MEHSKTLDHLNCGHHVARLDAAGSESRGFFKLMIAFRKSHACIGRPVFWREDVLWHGPHGPVDLGYESRWEDHTFRVAEGQTSDWRRIVDTARPSPEDIAEPGHEPALETANYIMRLRSVVVLRRARIHG